MNAVAADPRVGVGQEEGKGGAATALRPPVRRRPSSPSPVGDAPAAAPPAPRFVAYYRVSTDKQGRSGLGLEAQRAAVALHAARVGGAVVAEYQEVESGRRDDRPQLAAALAACRARRAVLLIAKLDRLARSVSFIANLMDGATRGGVDFVAADMPQVTRLTVHVLAAVAEHEREMTSQRTRAALAAAKARGTRLGNPRLAPGTPEGARAAAAARRAAARERAARDVLPAVEEARAAGARTLAELARALDAAGVAPPGGGPRWHLSAVWRALRYGAGRGAAA